MLKQFWRSMFRRSPDKPLPVTQAVAATRPAHIASTVTTHRRTEAEQAWRTGDNSVSEIRVGGHLVVTASIEMSAGPGFLGLSGESHYQDALRAAKASSPNVDEPVFQATLIAEPTNQYDPNAVAVLIEPFGKVGYIPKMVADRFSRIVRGSQEAVRCPAQLRGGVPTKPFIGVVLDTTRATGSRLSMYDPANSPQVDKYWEMRRASEAIATAAKALESTDMDHAFDRYREALAKILEREVFAIQQSVFPGQAADTPDHDHTNVVDRLTLCLARRGRPAEAVAEAKRFFDSFPLAKESHSGKAIVARVEKASRMAERRTTQPQ